MTLADRGFSTGGRLLTVGKNQDGIRCVHLWDPKTGKVIARCSLGKKSAYNITISPDGKTVACSYHMAKEICLFDVVSGKLISRIAQPGHVRRARFAPDGRTLISLSAPGGLCLWEVKTGKELWQLRLRLPEKSPWHLREKWETHHTFAFSPDGKVLAVALQDGSIHLCDMKTGAEVRRLFREVSRADPSQLTFSPDGHHLAAHAEENVKERNSEKEEYSPFVIRLWDVRSAQLVRTFHQFRPPLSHRMIVRDPRAVERYYDKYRRDSGGLAFSPDGKTVANFGSVTQLWEVATGRLRHEFDADTYAGCFSPDGRLIAANCIRVNLDASDKKDSGSSGATADGVRLWDWRDPCLKQPTSLGTREIERLCSDLASADATVGYRAISVLLAHPRTAVAVLKERLRRVEPIAPGELDRLIANLDNDAFAVRARAGERLAALGELARPALLRVKAQRPSLEIKRRIEDLLPRLSLAGSPERLRCLRAVEVLETIGTEETGRVLKKLASGAEGAVETEDAKAALNRLDQK
ncbi:MAG TPA: PQQ-binding-like beta-propeller repeat protein [Gemmataceae bacterium]